MRAEHDDHIPSIRNPTESEAALYRVLRDWLIGLHFHRYRSDLTARIVTP